MKPTLLILAAGRGSRFGGAKQVAPMGPHGETIMEYSIYDALNNGFNQVVLVINKDVEQDTFELVDKMTTVKNKISYAYQDLYTEMIPADIQAARLKPWGTAHAIMSACDQIDGSFAMINADDYYGKDAFSTMASYLQSHTAPNNYSMIGYDLANTLSANGTVSRGISISDTNGFLASIVETHGIHAQGDKIIADGNQEITEGLASMNFWGFQNNLFSELKTQFKDFLNTAKDLTKDEYQIPTVIDQMIKKGMIEVSVLHSGAKWFGVTYKEDASYAAKAIQGYVASGKYPSPLWV
ncbi:NTP transferase domain-containing protein [Reichenbachiella carrageenanivorans]|uniref:NTP transferase domain-containing protein n=1 Tax=Reichenbachiella carrageenanivorans TaxID=2979869 RepID=A0ABY6D0N5_9BACT|nr:sugar phosphate nucleotidyltransferase [Reichenbachiella carrageenanivorans]UXX79264.1 NTP transferase domain-containing protein [Reichenbachiella carrageenanivorans]